ncbi:MAG: UDP-N-acetylmuramoyl-L-alanine--D-glutamate ligase, partial [Negativicutes bacterium]|nr:UDP-N-acetylmuramoyl-L-alanine--D-glutamate ligase [Negativicutes bacterium]
KVVQAIFYGQAADRFAVAAAAAGVRKVSVVADLPAAVAEAGSVAGASVILLSPACASYDQYDNFEQRGRHFKQLVAVSGERL